MGRLKNALYSETTFTIKESYFRNDRSDCLNQERRKKLGAACDHISAASAIVTEVLTEEEIAMASTPDNLTGTGRYEAMEDAAGEMTDVIMALDEIEERIREI